MKKRWYLTFLGLLLMAGLVLLVAVKFFGSSGKPASATVTKTHKKGTEPSVIKIINYKENSEFDYLPKENTFSMTSKELNGVVDGKMTKKVTDTPNYHHYELASEGSFTFHTSKDITNKKGSVKAVLDKTAKGWKGTVTLKMDNQTYHLTENFSYPSSTQTIKSLKTAYTTSDYTSIYQTLSGALTKQMTLEQFLKSTPKGVTVQSIVDDGAEQTFAKDSLVVMKKPVSITIVQNGQTRTAKTNWVFVLEDGQWKFVGEDK
jgi:hypothetical protein